MSKPVAVASKAKFEFKTAYAEFLKPFPKKALSGRPGPGKMLTSVSPQYIVERLNETVGIEGWSHRGEYKVLDTDKGKVIVFEGNLIIDNGEKSIVQQGAGAAMIRGNVSDAYKSAKTESFSKCASLFGLANDVFKGLVSPPSSANAKPRSTTAEDF